MREIKFRAWDKRTRKMVETGFYIMGEVNCFDLLYQYGMQHGKRKNEPGLLRMNSFIIMQYTGLEDKNGVEIYEGDILADKVDRAIIVEWDENWSSWVGKFNPQFKYCLSPIVHNVGNDDKSDSVEVIGNIYENPELLERTNR